MEKMILLLGILTILLVSGCTNEEVMIFSTELDYPNDKVKVTQIIYREGDMLCYDENTNISWVCSRGLNLERIYKVSKR